MADHELTVLLSEMCDCGEIAYYICDCGDYLCRPCAAEHGEER